MKPEQTDKKEITLTALRNGIKRRLKEISPKETLEIYNNLTGYDYTYDDVDWYQ